MEGGRGTVLGDIAAAVSGLARRGASCPDTLAGRLLPVIVDLPDAVPHRLQQLWRSLAQALGFEGDEP